MRKFLRYLRIFSVLLLLIVLFPLPALAVAAPDLMEIQDVEVFRHLLEDDDYLVIITYNIEYTVLPSETADNLFIIRLMDGVTELGSNMPYPYINYGYGIGCMSLYWDAATAPTWGTLYDVRLEGNPLMFAPPLAPIIYTLQAGDFVASTDPDVQKTFLASRIRSIADDMQTLFGAGYEMLDSTDSGTYLSALGEYYFYGAVPGIQVMCPELFILQKTTPEWEDRDWGDPQVDVFPVTTGIAETSATVTLTYKNYPGNTNGITVTSSEPADIPVVSTYNDDQKTVLITGLDNNNTRNLTVSYRYNAKADEFESRWDHTIVSDAFSGLAELMGGIAKMTASSLLIIALALVPFMICYKKFKQTDAGLAMMDPVVLGGWQAGLFASSYLGLLCIVSVFILGYYFFYRGTNG